jgi:ribose 5-phosphate isomerase B
MKIFIGADHQGYYLKNQLVDYLRRSGYELVDDGDKKLDPLDDFPVFASKVVKDILTCRDDSDPRGILLCGSGQGMCMAANRYKGIRAALVHDQESARNSRSDDNSNVACIPAKSIEQDHAKHIVETWLNTPFANAPRYRRRLAELDELG